MPSRLSAALFAAALVVACGSSSSRAPAPDASVDTGHPEQTTDAAHDGAAHEDAPTSHHDTGAKPPEGDAHVSPHDAGFDASGCTNTFLCLNGCPCPTGYTCLSSGKCAAPGEGCSPTCADGAPCESADECASGACNAGVCGEPACSPTCASYTPCGKSDECASGFCFDNLCEPYCPAPATAMSSGDALTAAACAANGWSQGSFPVAISTLSVASDGTASSWSLTYATNVATTSCSTQPVIMLTVQADEPITGFAGSCMSGLSELMPLANSTSVVPSAVTQITQLAGDAGVTLYSAEIGGPPFFNFPSAGGWQVEAGWSTNDETEEAVIQFDDSGASLACETITAPLSPDGAVGESTMAGCP